MISASAHVSRSYYGKWSNLLFKTVFTRQHHIVNTGESVPFRYTEIN
jgi:hypothetical protein